jgi:hypothetical protein
MEFFLSFCITKNRTYFVQTFKTYFMEVNLSTQIRTEVTKWINSKNKSLDSGLELLKKTGYKPHVCHNFIINKHRRDIPLKLENQLRLYLRYFANPKNPIHNDVVSDFYQKNETQDNENTQEIFNTDKNFDMYPAIIRECFIQFRDLYTQRSILHSELKSIGEDNSKSTICKREIILSKMDAASQRMDELWKEIDEFKKYGSLPSENFVNSKLDLNTIKVSKPDPEPEEANFVLADNITDLTKQSDGWRTKIVKAKNRLKYQSEKKQEKLNPMPEGPKKIKLERRIERLTKEKLIIDTALANLK